MKFVAMLFGLFTAPLALVGLAPSQAAPVQQKVLDIQSPLRAPGSLVSPEQYESWLRSQSDLAFESMIVNIGGYGEGLEHVLPGTAIASPSRQDPNYYYQWTRDTAITINSIVMRYNDGGAQNSTLRDIILEYIGSCSKIQHIDNPSGTFENLQGLGEPKFMVDGTPFLGLWGRPQRDGPALRASTMIDFVNSEIRHNGSTSYGDFKSLYWNVIRPDLEYVAQNWRNQGFDVWEEVYGVHFFTVMVQLRALIAGSQIAHHMDDALTMDRYRGEAHEIRWFLETKFFNHQHLIETLNYDRSGLDAALLLGSIHALNLYGWDGQDTDSIVYPPYSDEMIASLHLLVNDMRFRYPINIQRLMNFVQMGRDSRRAGVGVGRYPEDVYDGVQVSSGNPWFLCTAAVAQCLYILADNLVSKPNGYELVFPEPVRPFYEVFVGDQEGWGLPTFNLSRSDAAYSQLVQDIADYADSFLDVIREHQAADGSMSEQFSRYDGYMRGADKLTWSYSAFWSAARQRTATKHRLKALL
jgi:glucoamylase